MTGIKTLNQGYCFNIGFICYIINLVPVGSPSRRGNVMVHVKDMNQPSLSTPF